MEEKAELLQRNKGSRKSYGSVAKYSEASDDDKLYDKPTTCLCTKRDCILVSILSVLVVTAIIVSLALGIPKIRSKQQIRNIDNDEPLTPQVSNRDTSFPPSADGITITPQQNPSPKTNDTSNSTVVLKQSALYKRAAVSADDSRCAEIGSNVLRENGSAVDAAISALLCMEAVNPQHSGIGGGFLMLVYSRKENKTYAIDARETAPANASKDMLTNNTKNGLLVGIPGVVKGMAEVHKRFGQVPWSQLFQPTIKLCTDGITVGSALATALKEYKDVILQENSLRNLFANNNEVLKENELLKRPGLAKTLQLLASQGEKEFYQGEIAKQIVKDVQAKGGIITLADMQNYAVDVKEALKAEFGSSELRLHTLPPPSSGALLPFVLNILDSYHMNSANLLTDDEFVRFLQRLVESYKFGLALKSRLGDERYANVSTVVRNLTSRQFALEIKKYIYDNMTFEPDYYLDKTLPADDHGTTHLNVFAPNGDIVTVTSTINSIFGAKFRSETWDVMFNDEMNDFTSPTTKASPNRLSNEPNLIAAGKRPLSSMMPSIIFGPTGEPIIVIGGSGGSAIFTSVANVLARHLILNQPMEEAIAAPRMHHKLVPNVLHMETSFLTMYIEALSNIGHNISLSAPRTHVNAVYRMSNGTLQAIGDPRIDIGIAGF